MPRTAISVQRIGLTGLAPAYTAMPGTGANNGISFSNDGETFLEVINTGTGAATLTLDATGMLAGIALSDQTANVANGGVAHHIGPFPPEAFGGTVGVDSSLAVGVTCAAIRLPRP